MAGEGPSDHRFRNAERAAEQLSAISRFVRSRPKRAVQRSVLNRLRDVFRLKLRNSVEVRNRARNFQDSVMGASAEPLLRHGAFEQTLTIGGKLAEFANGLRRHLRVAVEFLAFGRKARQLKLTGADHALQNFA